MNDSARQAAATTTTHNRFTSLGVWRRRWSLASCSGAGSRQLSETSFREFDARTVSRHARLMPFAFTGGPHAVARCRDRYRSYAR